MRVIGLDVHRSFAVVVFLEGGRRSSGGRIELTRDVVTAFGRLSIGVQNWLFSIRPTGVKRFQAVSPAMGNAARGSALLFGISRLALPAWDQGDGAEQSDSRPGYELAAGTRAKANSPHPSSREGHRSAGGGTRDCLSFGRKPRRPVRRQRARPLSSSGIPCHRSTCDA
jgi:hypothetical protein